jgi:DNA-directed RNA polymerase specialized sigma subunit
VLSKDIEIVPVRNLSYEDAEKEIIEYLQKAGKRRVYISEIVKKLRLDIELVAEILHKWRDEMCKNLCEEDGLICYTSYHCPVVDCRYNNYGVRQSW